MPFETQMQMTLALLQQLLVALLANKPYGFKAWLFLGHGTPREPAVIALIVHWMDPILNPRNSRCGQACGLTPESKTLNTWGRNAV